jgi:hypothetical protein
MFVALKDKGTDISLGIPVRKNDNSSYVKWFKTSFRIFIASAYYNMVRNGNEIIDIFSNTKGDIIIIGGNIPMIKIIEENILPKKWIALI